MGWAGPTCIARESGYVRVVPWHGEHDLYLVAMRNTGAQVPRVSSLSDRDGRDSGLMERLVLCARPV